MPVKFCSSCGTKISFELKMPKFCPKCGKEPMASLKVEPAKVDNTRKTDYNFTYTPSSVISQMEEDADIDLNLVSQIKANLLRSLDQRDVNVINIPIFRVPIQDLDKHPELGQ